MGDQLGRYEVLKHLAPGDIAELLLARADGLDGFQRHVVIKQLREEFASDDGVVDAFVTEARLAATLHHQHIVQVYDIGQEGGSHYFAMEYVHGEELRRLLARAFEANDTIPIDHAVSIVMAAATALHHAHEQKGSDDRPLHIVHRDVSPANILVGYDGNIKVVDFGIARAAVRTAATQAGMLRGKAPYMSPEQCKGGKLDRRSDVFSLGSVLYELVTCRRLFKASNEYLTMAAVVACQVPPPSKYRADLPPALEAIIMQALSPEPAARFQTAKQMLEALDALAVESGLRASSHALAAYMKRVFGERAEPWTANGTVSPQVDVDFDGKGTGLAPPPAEAHKPKPVAKVTAKTSPIDTVRAHQAAVPVAPIAASATTPVQIPTGAPAAAEPTRESSRRKKAPSRAPVPPPKRQKQKTIQIPTSAQAATAAPAEPSAAPRTDPTPLPGVASAPRADATPSAAVEAPVEKPVEKPPAASPFPVLSPTAFIKKEPAAPAQLFVKADSPFPVLAAAATEPKRADTAPELPPPPKLSSSPALVLPLAPPSSATGEESAIRDPILPMRPTPSPIAMARMPELEGEDTTVDPTREGFKSPVEAVEEALVAKRSDQPTEVVVPLPPPVGDPDFHGDGFAMEPTRGVPRKRLLMIGGGVAALLVIVLAIGLSGGGSSDEPAGPTPEENAAAIAKAEPPQPAAATPPERTWASSQQAATEQPKPTEPVPPPAPTIDEAMTANLMAFAPAGARAAASALPIVDEPTPEPVEPPPTPAKPKMVATAKPAATKPAAVATAKPAATKPAVATAKPAATKPAAVATAKPAATKPAVVATAKPAATKPAAVATAKPAATKPAAVATAKPAATKPAATKPTATKPAAVTTTKPAATKPAATKPAPTKPAAAAAKKPPVKPTTKPKAGWDPNSLFPK